MNARFLAAAAILSMSGCTSYPFFGPLSILRHAKSVELYRVHGSNGTPVAEDAGVDVLDHDYVVEARGPAIDPRRAADALLHHVSSGGPVASCFDPHHAMRVSDGTRTIDFVVCFHCLQVFSYENGKELQVDPVSGSEDDVEAIFLASHVAKVAPPPDSRPRTF